MTHIKQRKNPPPIGKYLKVSLYTITALTLGYHSFNQFIEFGATRDYHHYGIGFALMALALIAFRPVIKITEGRDA